LDEIHIRRLSIKVESFYKDEAALTRGIDRPLLADLGRPAQHIMLRSWESHGLSRPTGLTRSGVQAAIEVRQKFSLAKAIG
jgi:hypothetical protein